MGKLLRRRSSVGSVSCDEEKEIAELRNGQELRHAQPVAGGATAMGEDGQDQSEHKLASGVSGTFTTSTSTEPSSARSLPSLPKYQTRRFTVHPRLGSDDDQPGRRRSSIFHLNLLQISKVRSASSAIMTMVPLLFILASFLIPVYFVPMIADGEYPSSQVLLPVALAGITVIPATLFLGWCQEVFHNSLIWEDPMKSRARRRDGYVQALLRFVPSSTEGICFPLAILFRQTQNTLQFYIDEEYQQLYSTLLNQAAAICTFVGWIGLLDSVHGKLLAYAKRVDAIAEANPNSQKWKAIMKSFCSYEDREKEEGYAIPGGHQSAARVLADIVGIYCNIGKILGATLLVFVFLGIDLYSSLVALGLTVVFASFISALHINEAFKNMVSLAISNAVHVGDIISIGRSGFKPADNPDEFVTGFVEGFSWCHVIIRDFKRKQTFIRHDEFGKLTFHNWSRRPTKHAHFIIPIVPELSGGADRLSKLAMFTTRWLKEHKQIDQAGYQKAVVKLTAEKGLVLEVIFFPVRGAKARQIRSEFVVMVLDAAKRFNLCLMPAEVRSSSPWPFAQDGDGSIEDDGYMNTELEDLLPSPTLTKRAGYKPKIT